MSLIYRHNFNDDTPNSSMVATDSLVIFKAKLYRANLGGDAVY